MKPPLEFITRSKTSPAKKKIDLVKYVDTLKNLEDSPVKTCEFAPHAWTMQFLS